MTLYAEEEEQRHLRELNAAILNSVRDIVVVTDLAGRITYFNPAAERATGYTKAEIRGRLISELYEDAAFSDGKLNFIRQTGEANVYEATIRTKDGRSLTLEVNKAPLPDSSGQLIGFAAISRDVTKRQQAEGRARDLQNLVTGPACGYEDRELIGTRISTLMDRQTPAVGPDETIGQAAEKLIQLDLPALPVVGPAQEVLGLLTLKDLVEKGLFQGVDLSTPVSQVMRSEFPTVPPDTFYFEAMMAMVKGRTQALIVADGRHLRGLVTIQDMMRSRGASFISVLDGIESQTSIDGLARFRGEVDRILQSLVVDGALASHIAAIITEFNDRLTRKVLALCQGELGLAPAAFAWLGLGSEGRKEQTLTGDQDNAMVVEDEAITDDWAQAYFSRLADLAVQGLNKCGFKLCPGGIMASNPQWTGGLRQWLRRVRTWIQEPTPARTRAAMTFLDFRRVYGRKQLETELRSETNRIFTENPRVLTAMAEDTLSKTPPLGLFKRFVLERSGPHKGMVNLKTVGTLILIDCLRLLAVKEGLFETNTLERLAGLERREILPRDQAASIKEAYETLMGLRLWNIIKAIREGREPSSHLDPDTLPAWHQQRLKDAYSVAEDLQKTVREIFWWVG